LVAKKKLSRAVIVDAKGLVAGLVEWPDGELPPNPNIIVRDKEGAVQKVIKRSLVQDLYGYNNSLQRWNKKAKSWADPPLRLVVVSEATGSYLKSFNTWPGMIPALPDGFAIVDDIPDKALGDKRSLTYDFDNERWIKPVRVAVVDQNGVVVNIAMENPDSKTAFLTVEEGFTKLGHQKGGLPKDEDGDEIAIGCRLDKARGKWVNPKKIKVQSEVVTEGKLK
jgi:hypothetical protein